MNKAKRLLTTIEDMGYISPDKAGLFPDDNRSDVLDASKEDVAQLESEIRSLEAKLADKLKNANTPENRRDIPSIRRRIQALKNKIQEIS